MKLIYAAPCATYSINSLSIPPSQPSLLDIPLHTVASHPAPFSPLPLQRPPYVAPASTRKFAALSRPFFTASLRAVLPKASWALTSAPILMSTRTIAYSRCGSGSGGG